MLETAFTRLAGCAVPIQLAGMGSILSVGDVKRVQPAAEIVAELVESADRYVNQTPLPA